MPNINKVVYGNTTLIDLSTTTLSETSQLANGITAYDRAGNVITGTASGSGTGTVVIEDTTDSHGGTVRTITAVDISDTTAVAADVAQGKYFYTAGGVKTQGTASGGGSSSAQTETGTFSGGGGNVETISCSFAPDLVYIHGDLSSSASLRGIVTLAIIKDTYILVTCDSSTSRTGENLMYGAYGITGYSTDTTNPYATYSNGTLTINTVTNSGSARWASGISYSYKLVKWS